MEVSTLDKNPLVDSYKLPPFSKISSEHVVPAVKNLLQVARTDFENLLSDIEPKWTKVIEPLADISEKLNRVWGPICHLQSVRNTPSFRKEYEKVVEDIVSFNILVSQNEKIYKALTSIKASEEWKNLTSSKKRIINGHIQEAELAGVGLSLEERNEFQSISQKLSKLEIEFSNNVLDSTKEYKLIIKNKEDIKNIPEGYLELYAQNFNSHESADEKASPKDGPWLISLDGPSFIPFMEYCQKQSLRKEIYYAYLTRASQGKYDNTQILQNILRLRKTKAKMLGFNNFSQLSLQQKMAATVDEVYSLHEDLRRPALENAKKEMLEISEFAQKQGLQAPLKHWDMAFYSRLYRDKKFQFSHEELRPYFPLPGVLKGLFTLVKHLFSIEVKERKGIDVWNPDVKFFDVYGENNNHVASFFLDPYSRIENKRGGAWMDDCISRRKDSFGKIQNPVAYLVCNFTPPVSDKPSLLSFRDVETLFHEFGHGLQHMLTQINELDASGINNIEWDAVELPSQFMENWCYHKKTFFSMAYHYQTKESIPAKYYDKILSSRTYLSGIGMLKQLQFGILDMKLHDRFDVDKDHSVFEEHRKVAKTTSILPLLNEDRFLCSFSHIFSGGYAAGYYSYKWAEVLSADAFSAFEDVGLENDKLIKEIGEKFRNTILAKGGSDHPKNIFREFRGRDPKTYALLKHNGLLGKG